MNCDNTKYIYQHLMFDVKRSFSFFLRPAGLHREAGMPECWNGSWIHDCKTCDWSRLHSGSAPVQYNTIHSLSVSIRQFSGISFRSWLRHTQRAIVKERLGNSSAILNIDSPCFSVSTFKQNFSLLSLSTVRSQVAQAKFIRNVCRYLAVRNMTKKYNKNALPCVRCVFLVLAWCFRPF